MTDWTTQTASDLGRAIGAGQIDPVDLTDAFLAAIDAHDSAPRIYARLTRDRARAEAKAAAARAKSNTRLGLLDGVPISWKDLFDTAGTATEAGSLLLQGRTPTQDAHVLANATRAGLVCLGKTHMSELAFSGLGLNPVYGKNLDPKPGTPPNINDPDSVPGGSSSGAAASVAHGLAAAGIGSDTGGSVRVPAAYNDLVGLKTTHGRLSLRGTVPLAAKFDTIGPIARNVEDCAALLAVMENATAPDLRGASLLGKRFLILSPYDQDGRRTSLAGFRAACDAFSNAGAVLDRGKIAGLAEAMDLAPILFAAEAYGLWSDTIEAAPDKMFPRILERFRAGGAFKASDYVAAWHRLDAIRAEWHAATAAYDGVILPSVASAPANITRLMDDADYYICENLLALRNTRVGNLMGLCGISLPTGVPSAGVMILCPPMAEAKLLRLGAAAEQALTPL